MSLIRVGNFKKAAECGIQALQNTKVAFGEDHFHVSGILLRLGVLQYSLNQPEEAKASFERALAIRVKKFGQNHSYVADVYQEIGKMKMKQHQRDEAREAFEKALKIREKECGMDSVAVKETKASLRELGIL